MLKHALAAAAFAACFATPADAQDDAPLPPVESMNCEQMQAELTVAGQRMNAQMDPEFANEAQAMMDEAQGANRSAAGSMATGVGMGIACSVPGVAYACMAAQQAQAANAQREAAEHQARMNAQIDRLNDSMEGIDQQRMMAISDRYEQMQCQTPQ
jgi:hypothetical protein